MTDLFSPRRLSVRSVAESVRPATRAEADRVLRQAGYQRLGTGMFAAIYQKPNAAYVLKVFSRRDHAYLDFIALARQHQDNPHFPRFFGKLVVVNAAYAAIRMEKLAPFNPHRFGEPAYALFDYIQDGQDDGDLRDFPMLKAACDLVRRKLLSRYAFDPKDDNFMTRGDTIVITDPALDLSAKDALRWEAEPALDAPRPASSRDDDDLLRQLGSD